MGYGVHHRLTVAADVGVVRLRVRLEFGAAWTVVFGPSGSGKTSLLRAMCGLLGEGGGTSRVPPEDTQNGRGERDAEGKSPLVGAGGLEELRGEHSIWRAPRLRRIAYAPQGAVLFPHLTVAGNVAFAGTARGMDTSRLVAEAMELFALQAMAGRMPRELSGGESQRVSLARAFAVPGARLMLLDEPFNGVGRAQRDLLLPGMRETMARRGVPVISVTHDVEEAFLLGAEVVRLEAGEVVAQGPAQVVLAAERAEMLRVLRG
jgi:molybdate transport system ATP-binding protein